MKYKSYRLMRPEFNTHSDLWADDGSLRDVYIQDMQLQNWDRFDSLLRHHELAYSFDGKPACFPGSRAIFSNREGGHLLSVMLGQVSVNCHFFVESQLELDISPREILGNAEHDAVLDFIEQLALGLELPADVTPENAEARPMLSYSPRVRCWTVHSH
ncbi:hypothetical protein HSX11_29415 [Oxalobacteraceae bacterium]|nr:hypothetical protein [Oxalobacteraceae bacterium]